MSYKWRPSDEYLLQVLNAPDPVIMLIRGFLCIESLLDIGITDRCIAPECLDLDALGAVQKINIATSLGVLPKDIRPATLEINRLRNRFAHDPEAQLSDEEARRLLDASPERLRFIAFGTTKRPDLKPQKIVAHMIAAVVKMLEHQISLYRDEREAGRILHDMVIEKLGPEKLARPNQPDP